jgi:hypothetical protein
VFQFSGAAAKLKYIKKFSNRSLGYRTQLDEKMKLTKDAKILSADGKNVGNLNRFVLDPRTKRISHIVFEQGFLPKTEHVLPMELVDFIDDDGIHLMHTEAKPDELPLFEEDRFIITNEHALMDEGVVTDTGVENYYYYPPVSLGASGIQQPNTLNTYHQTDQRPRVIRGNLPTGGKNNPPLVKNTDQNIPDGSVALKEGAKVVSSDQKHVGNVEKVIIAQGSDEATHLLITKGLLNREKKLIPIDWVEQVLEEEVSLSIGEDFIDRLPDYKE